MAITSVRLPESVKQAVEELARREGRTAHAFMLEAIEEKVALARERQSFLDEGRTALQEIEAGVPTVAFDEMVRWMRARAQGDDVAAPESTDVAAPEGT